MKKSNQLFVIESSFSNDCSLTVEKINDHFVKCDSDTHLNVIDSFVIF